ncbi:hypothetical protein AVEN_68387-1, partial [Araneus ventricosus]
EPGNFIPRCDSNGDYKKAQCNDAAYCYCVDPKTGKQVSFSRLVRIDSLLEIEFSLDASRLRLVK